MALVFEDDFNRTETGTIGTTSSSGAPYTEGQPYGSGGTWNVNGSYFAVDPDSYMTAEFPTDVASEAVVQFDFFVPLDPDVEGIREVGILGGLVGDFLTVQANGGGEWNIYSTWCDFYVFPELGEWYTVKLETDLANQTGYRIRVWKRSDPEPSTWDSEATGSLFPINASYIYVDNYGGTDTADIDNIQFYGTGPSVVNGSLTADAILKFNVGGSGGRFFTADAFFSATTPEEIEGSFTADAWIGARQTSAFTSDAYIIRGGRTRHSPELHFGEYDDTAIVLSADVGGLTAGSTLHDALVELESQITARENSGA